MRLNLGCGFKKHDGWVNVDKVSACQPDKVVDLEIFPWPWPESSVEEVLLSHLLEHIGHDSAVFMQFMRELWRVCHPSALITVQVPHPRCDEFLWDATHVRPITGEGLRMFSQARNREVIESGNPETPLGMYAGVDFEVTEIRYIWKKSWLQRLQNAEVSEDQLYDWLRSQLNVAKEIWITLHAIKPPRFSAHGSDDSKPFLGGHS